MNTTQGRFRIKNNVTYKVVGKDGALKRIFQPYAWVTALIRSGFLSARHPKVPFLFGFWSDSMIVSNLVVDAGKAAVAGLINGVVTNFFEYIAVGTGATAAAAGDTALQTEIVDSGLARVSATTSRVTTDVTNDTAQLQTTFSVSGTKAVTESGVLDSASTGTLLARQVFSAINVVSGDSLQITWKFDVD